MKQSLKVAGTALLGAGVGFVIGFKVTEKRLAARFEERLEEETAGMKEFYTNVKQKYESPEEAAAALIPPDEEPIPEDPREKTQRVQYNKIVKNYVNPLDEFKADQGEACETEEVVRTNVFDSQPPGVPRIITQEQFMSNETGYEQATLTFYAKGGVLTDQRDDIIDNPDDVLGKMFSEAFGEGSSDPNTVHVQVDSLQMEFEIIKSERSYEEDVLGQDESETPSHHRRL